MTRRALFAISLSFAIAGCTAMQGEMARSDADTVESQLRIAGFQLVPSDTQARIDAMRTMPPLVFSRVERDGKPFVVYVDPDSCRCLWIGTEANFARYRQLAAEAQLATNELIAQDIAIDANLWDPEWGSIDDPATPAMDPDRP